MNKSISSLVLLKLYLTNFCVKNSFTNESVLIILVLKDLLYKFYRSLTPNFDILCEYLVGFTMKMILAKIFIKLFLISLSRSFFRSWNML